MTAPWKETSLFHEAWADLSRCWKKGREQKQLGEHQKSEGNRCAQVCSKDYENERIRLGSFTSEEMQDLLFRML